MLLRMLLRIVLFQIQSLRYEASQHAQAIWASTAKPLPIPFLPNRQKTTPLGAPPWHARNLSEAAKNRAAPNHPLSPQVQPTPATIRPCTSDISAFPIGALMLAASVSAWAQSGSAPETSAGQTLSTVTVREKAEAPEGKDTLQTRQTTIGKGKQDIRDIPQSISVMTEKLIDDRKLDTLKEALHHTAGITFAATEMAPIRTSACATSRWQRWATC